MCQQCASNVPAMCQQCVRHTQPSDIYQYPTAIRAVLALKRAILTSKFIILDAKFIMLRSRRLLT